MAEREPSIIKNKSRMESSLAEGVPIGPSCWTGYSVNQREGSMNGGAPYHVNTTSERKLQRGQVDGTNVPFLFFTFPIYLMLDLFWLLKVMHQMRWKTVTWYKNFQRRVTYLILKSLCWLENCQHLEWTGDKGFLLPDWWLFNTMKVIFPISEPGRKLLVIVYVE